MKTGIEEALRKTVLPRQENADDTNLSSGPRRSSSPRKGGAGGRNPGERALETVRVFMLDARLDRTLPAGATGLDSGLRRNDMGIGPLIRFGAAA